jgi:hypothetical protein
MKGPTKEQKEVATEYGYELGVYYRKKLIAWFRNLFKRR